MTVGDRNERGEPIKSDEASKLVIEVERLAKKVCELQSLSPEAPFHGLPLWVSRVSPEAVAVIARGNPLWEEFRQGSYEAFGELSVDIQL